MNRPIRVRSSLNSRRPVGARRALGSGDDPNIPGEQPDRDTRIWGAVVTVGLLGVADAALLAYGITTLAS